MGKVKDKEKKMKKILAQLMKIDSDFIERKDDFQKDLEIALAMPNKKKKLLKLSRLNDEANGYFIRIYHNLTGANKLYTDYTAIKDIKKLGKLLNAKNEVINLEELLDKLKESRHKSAHPDQYFINEDLHSRSTDIHIAIKTYIDKLSSINTVDDVSLKREEHAQDNHMIQGFTSIKRKNDKHKIAKKKFS